MLFQDLIKYQQELSRIAGRKVSLTIDSNLEISVFIGGADRQIGHRVANHFRDFASKIAFQPFPNSIKVIITLREEFLPSKLKFLNPNNLLP